MEGEKLNANLNEALQAVRRAKGISQSEMAQKLGLSMNGYWAKENGVRKTTIQEALKIAKILDVDVNAIFKLEQ